MMKRITFCFMCLFIVSATMLQAQRGALIDYAMLHKLNVGEIKLLLAEIPPTLVDLALTNPDDNAEVEVYRLIYSTIDAQGDPTYASGAVFLSPDIGADNPLAVYLHGTITSDNEAPSRLGGKESLLGWILGADGYIGILPDYLGLGDSPGIHPYSHSDTEASASIDMVLATKEFLYAKYGYTDNRSVFLSGYSQGGHSALAVQREIEWNYPNEFNLILNVAGSGAYCLSSIQKNYILDNPDYGRPGHIPYLVLGYKSVYPFFDLDLDEIFVEPYLSMIPGLFDRTKSIGEIEDELNVTYWTQMMKRRFLLGLKYNYYHPMNRAMRDNDLVNWKPRNPLILLYCRGDKIVNPYNSMAAWILFHLRGAYQVAAIDLGNLGHEDCAIPALAITKILFDCHSPMHPCILDLGLKSSGVDQYMNELTYEEALKHKDEYGIEEIN
ncbi:MAG: alpha/beta fold hydrolase, partial [Bacteroidales bacterium]